MSETNINLSGLPYWKRYEKFNCGVQPSFDPYLIAGLAALGTLEKAGSTFTFLFYLAGSGRTTLANGIGLEAGCWIFFAY